MTDNPMFLMFLMLPLMVILILSAANLENTEDPITTSSIQIQNHQKEMVIHSIIQIQELPHQRISDEYRTYIGTLTIGAILGILLLIIVSSIDNSGIEWDL